jgi:hypothetical protein
MALLTTQTVGANLQFGAKTVLVYDREIGGEQRQFVLRIARFHPDIFVEWESLSHQGTVHMHAKAVTDSQKLTIERLFEAGVDKESKDVMTKWFSQKLYRQLIEKRNVKVQLDKGKVKLRLVEEDTYPLTVDGESIAVPVIRVEDDKNNRWLVYKNPKNPVVVEVSTLFFLEQLKRVSTSTANNLRWIRKLPPVK